MPINLLSPDTYLAGDPAQNGIPLEEIWRLQDEEPCLLQQIGDPALVPCSWVISRHADVLAATRDPRRFSSASGATLRQFEMLLPEHGGKPGMMTMDGEDHVRNRRIVSRGFTPVVLRAFEGRLRAICVEVIERALDEGQVDFVDAIAVELPMRAAYELIGVPEEDMKAVLRWTNASAYPADPGELDDPGQERATLLSSGNYALKLAEMRRLDPKEDLMSKVAAAFEKEQLSEDELQGMFQLLAIGGSDTTRNALTHGLHGLLRFPEQMTLLREQTSTVIETAVEEILRWSSPVNYVRRTATEDIELHGQTIKAGDPVALMLVAANHDRRVFDDPGRFDITRSPNPHITLSNGPHVCLGQAVARMEIRVVLEELIKRTSDIRQTGDIVYARESFLRGARSLPVELIR